MKNWDFKRPDLLVMTSVSFALALVLTVILLRDHRNSTEGRIDQEDQDQEISVGHPFVPSGVPPAIRATIEKTFKDCQSAALAFPGVKNTEWFRAEFHCKAGDIH